MNIRIDIDQETSQISPSSNCQSCFPADHDLLVRQWKPSLYAEALLWAKPLGLFQLILHIANVLSTATITFNTQTQRGAATTTTTTTNHVKNNNFKINKNKK